jgi:trehalose-6-phosphatase
MTQKPKLTLAIDFDGTIAHTEYPIIIALKPQAKEVINKLYDEGHIIIINSCRVNQYAAMMKNFLDDHGLLYHLINENSPHRIQTYGSDTRKISADLYIDDHNIGCEDINWLVVYEQIQSYIKKVKIL